MYQVSKLSNRQHRADAKLLHDMQKIIAPSYADYRDLLMKEVDFCDTCFLARHEDELVGFFMTRHYVFHRSGMSFSSVYLGLSAIAQHLKGTVAIRMLYGECLSELQLTDISSYDSSFLWGTTANPTVFVAASRYLPCMQPNLNGSFSESSLDTLLLLKDEFSDWGWRTKSSTKHPFVLHGVASARYSSEELERMSKFSRRFTLFEELGIDESNGDRLIFVAQYPRESEGRSLRNQTEMEMETRSPGK